ncbi:MAG: hypothetical protein KBT39_02755 [Bacteroidales bacterium]|nr:hypothetical protein [Bacteroidales bacterium]
MEATMTTPSAIQMTFDVSDAKIANHVKALLQQISAVSNIRMKKVKSEVELSLEEAHQGKVTTWNSVDDYFKTMMAK